MAIAAQQPQFLGMESQLQQRTIDRRLSWAPDNIDEECIDMMIKKGTYWVPSTVSIKTLIDLGFSNELMRSEYANVLKMLPVAQAAGVKIIAGMRR